MVMTNNKVPSVPLFLLIISKYGIFVENINTELAKIWHDKSRYVLLASMHSDADGVQNWPDCIARKLMETE